MATTTTTITNTGGIANSLNTPARADEDDVSVDCGTIGSSNDEEYIQVYRERILVGGSYFPPDNSKSGSDRWEWNGMLHDISSLFPATKSETDSSSLFSCPNSNSNSIKAIFPPHRSIDDNGMQHDISSLFPPTKSETDSSSLFSRPNSNSNSIMAIFPPHKSTDGSENDEIIIARNPSISSYFPAYFSDNLSSVSNEIWNLLDEKMSLPVRQDMPLSFFDNWLSNITILIDGDDALKSQEDQFALAEKAILRWDPSLEGSIMSLNWEDLGDEADEYLSAIDEILNLMDELLVRSDSEIVGRAFRLIQHAMSRLKDEFWHVLFRSTVPPDAERLYGSIRRCYFSFPVNDARIIAGEYDDKDDDEDGSEFESFSEDDRSSRFHERGPSLDDNTLVDLIDPKAMDAHREIATRMIRSGYEKECIHVYIAVCRAALDECLVILGIEKLSIEEVRKIEWNSLDEKMKKWIQAVKIVVRLILSGEKSLCDQIFCGDEFCGADETKEICFNETVCRSPEKLFRILDMYVVMDEALVTLEVLVTDDDVINDARDVLSGLGEAACGSFAEFKKAMQSETSKKPMPSGEIHPLTQYVMNYVKLIVNYSDTLNLLLENHEDDDQLEPLRNDDSDSLKLTPVTRQLLVLITSLHSNLEEKSKLYEDGALQYIFLMNNILYVMQKVKDSDLAGLLGDYWVRQKNEYARNYFWASWTKVLHCLKDDGNGGSSSNASRVALKERIKNFNRHFEEIYRVQTAWKVPDAKLRKVLRILISKKVIPDYRSFIGRFGNQVESVSVLRIFISKKVNRAYRSFMGRLGNQVESEGHAGKYIKYTADDLNDYLLDLFEGSPRVLWRGEKLRRIKVDSSGKSPALMKD